MPLRKIDAAELEELIAETRFLVEGTTTIALITLKSGFVLVSSSTPLNPDDYNEAIGKTVASRKAVDRLWELEGYHRLASGDPKFDADVEPPAAATAAFAKYF